MNILLHILFTLTSFNHKHLSALKMLLTKLPLFIEKQQFFKNFTFGISNGRDIKRFINNEAGVAAILGAILLPTLVGGAGLAVDGTRFLRAKSVIMSAADQAALAAASVDTLGTGETRQQIATKFFQANLPTEYTNIVTLNSFSFKDSSAVGGAVIIDYTINASIKTLVGGVVGINTLSVLHTGRATREIQNVEVVMALPMSGTMCSTKNRTPSPPSSLLVSNDVTLDLKPDPSCKHFNAMKKGVQSFADLMFKNQTISRFKLGLVPYNFKVRLPDTRVIHPLLSLNEWSDPSFFTNVNDANPLPTILPLSANRTKVNTAINSLALNENGTAWSRTNLPTLLSALMLDPTQAGYFAGIDVPEPIGSPMARKVFILMSDGSNIGCCFTNWQPGNFANQYVYFHKPDNDQTLAYCEAMKQNGIQIISIIFDVSESDVGGKEINNLFARCASGTYSDQGGDANAAQLICRNKQFCYNIKTSAQLTAAYEDIAQHFYVSRTTR